MTESDHSNEDWVPRAGDLVDRRYELEGFLDKGAIGVVMRATHTRMDREVAVKFLHPHVAREGNYRARFEREVKLATVLDHPNVVRCYDYGETEDGVLYLVMELLQGRNLKALLRAEGALSTHRAIDVAMQLLDGMAAAHAHGVIHRDLKPGNIFIGTDYRGRDTVKILDFGMAKSLVGTESNLTRTGSILGTATYLAPEALVVAETGKAGDVYALGLILLEMTTGVRTCIGSSMMQTFLQHLIAPARIPRRLWDTGYGRVVRRALIKHPHRRFSDARAMYEAMDDAESDTPDFVLTRSEVPDPYGDLDEAPLRKISGSGYTDLSILEDFPEPKPYDVDDSEELPTTRRIPLVDETTSVPPDLANTTETLLGDGRAEPSAPDPARTTAPAQSQTLVTGSGKRMLPHVTIGALAVTGVAIILFAILPGGAGDDATEHRAVSPPAADPSPETPATATATERSGPRDESTGDERTAAPEEDEDEPEADEVVAGDVSPSDPETNPTSDEQAKPTNVDRPPATEETTGKPAKRADPPAPTSPKEGSERETKQPDDEYKRFLLK